MSNLIPPMLEKLVEQAIDEFLKNISIERWERMKDGLHWEETVDGKSVQMEAEILQKTAETLTIGVSGSSQHISGQSSADLIGPEINRGSHFKIARADWLPNETG